MERFYEIWNDRIIRPYIHVDIWGWGQSHIQQECLK